MWAFQRLFQRRTTAGAFRITFLLSLHLRQMTTWRRPLRGPPQGGPWTWAAYWRMFSVWTINWLITKKWTRAIELIIYSLWTLRLFGFFISNFDDLNGNINRFYNKFLLLISPVLIFIVWLTILHHLVQPTNQPTIHSFIHSFNVVLVLVVEHWTSSIESSCELT